MQEILFSLLGVLAALFLVALNGLFVTAEFAFTKLRETRVESLVQQGRTSSGLVQEATGSLDTYLAVCQVGITIASLGLGALGEPAIAALISPLLESFLPENLIHLVAFALGFGIITFLHVTYGELVSKSIAIANPEGSALFVAPFMKFFNIIFRPLVWVTNGIANLSAGLVGIPPPSETEERHSEEELHMLVSQSSQQGILETEEEARVKAAFDLDEKAAREVMFSRPSVVAFPARTGLEELFSAAAEGNNVRFPISEDDRDDRIIGTVHVKDILRALKAHGDLGADVTARDIMHEVLTVPENRRVSKVLDDLQEQGLQMVVVIDEWGAFEGVFTIEDILEELVGEIRDEWEEKEQPAVRKLDDGSYAIDGSVTLRNLNETLNSGFESEDFGTVGGLALGQLGRIPEIGDEVSLDGYMMRIDEMDGPRIARLIAHEKNEKDSSEEEFLGPLGVAPEKLSLLFGTHRRLSQLPSPYQPPSTERVWPLTKPLAAGSARNATASAISSGVAKRPIGVRPSMSASV